MDTNEKNIVAIDLGSSKIALTVARVAEDDIQIIYYRETPSAGIKYSSVYNVTHVAEPVTRAIRQAEDDLGIKITQAVVGMPKFPIYQESSNATIRDRGEDTDITAEDIANLKSLALSIYPLQDDTKEAIFGAVAQSFSNGEDFQVIENDIIGMTGDVLEGNFKVFVGKKNDLRKIDSVMAKSEIVAMRKYFTAECTAMAVLTDAEMENGVALIDFGGGCTSVAIYHGNVMRHYASIPFGGRNITQDIKTECQISERLAENIKLAFGACMPDKLQSLSDKIIHIKSNSADADKQLTVKYLSEIITARVEEIMMAVLYEIEQSGFADMLRSGIVITGGCAKTANLGNLIYDISGYKVRTGYPRKIFSCLDCDGIAEPTSATSVGLILNALSDQTVNCTIEAPVSRVVTEIETESGTEIEVQIGVGQPGTEDNPQGELWADDEIEKIEVSTRKKKEKKDRERQPGFFKVTFTRIKEAGEKVGEKVKEVAYDLYQDIAEDEPNEN